MVFSWNGLKDVNKAPEIFARTIAVNAKHAKKIVMYQFNKKSIISKSTVYSLFISNGKWMNPQIVGFRFVL